MKKFSVLFVTISVLLLLTACATTHKSAEIQLGMTKNEVTSILGRPVLASAVEGKEILKFKLSRGYMQAWDMKGYHNDFYVVFQEGIVVAYGGQEPELLRMQILR